MIDGVTETLEYLSLRHELTLFTKGHPEEQKLKIDDPCGAAAVHGVNGAWGVLALGLFTNGKYGDKLNGVGGTVRDGFKAAYAMLGTNHAELHVYDTAAQGGAPAALQQARADGNALIVGPLTKPEVASLADMGSLGTSVLALNTLPAGPSRMAVSLIPGIWLVGSPVRSQLESIVTPSTAFQLN